MLKRIRFPLKAYLLLQIIHLISKREAVEATSQ